MSKQDVTISNIAGGDAKTFAWRGQLSGVAIRHADKIRTTFGGVVFSLHEAAEDYERVCDNRDFAEGLR